jgi:HlyD family secretion protein
MSEQLFRKVSLEKLSSPEQLDQLLQVTTPKSWVALLAIGFALAATVFWGIFGAIETDVAGQGILIKTGGVLDIESLSSGEVTTLYVRAGDIIERGQLVARVAQPKLMEDLNQKKSDLEQLKVEYDVAAQNCSREKRLKSENYTRLRSDYQQVIQQAGHRLQWLNEKLANRKELLDKGLVTKQDYNDTQKAIFDAMQEIDKARSNSKQTYVDEQDNNNKLDMDLLLKKQKINEKKTEIELGEENLELNSRVMSPYSGKVLEIDAQEGTPVSSGDSIVMVELTGEAIQDLTAVLYIDSGNGKKVEPGMEVQITPSTVKAEEWGCMLGIVTRVSEFPVTAKAMLRNLRNQKLVDNFSSKSAQIEIYADLIPDPNTKSKYKWSSPKGPPVRIETGTMCSAKVVVYKQPPITLVIPLLKKYILGAGQD